MRSSSTTSTTPSFDALSRAKFLAADMNGDHAVTLLDAAAVVDTVFGK